MTAVGWLAAILLVLGVALLGLLRADAARLARLLRLFVPVAAAVAGLLLILIGRVGIGAMLITGAVAWYSRQKTKMARPRTAGKRSSVRTSVLEMELDHDSGGLEGRVLSGPHAGKALGALSLQQLLELRSGMGGDEESLRLLETYLDSRFPVWRHDADADIGEGQRASPGSGAMTKEEAYQVLGLEAGASAAEIRQAHRRLMQRLHPDLGGSSFLAARINEARNVLVSDHD